MGDTIPGLIAIPKYTGSGILDWSKKTHMISLTAQPTYQRTHPPPIPQSSQKKKNQSSRHLHPCILHNTAHSSWQASDYLRLRSRLGSHYRLCSINITLQVLSCLQVCFTHSSRVFFHTGMYFVSNFFRLCFKSLNLVILLFFMLYNYYTPLDLRTFHCACTFIVLLLSLIDVVPWEFHLIVGFLVCKIRTSVQVHVGGACLSAIWFLYIFSNFRNFNPPSWGVIPLIIQNLLLGITGLLIGALQGEKDQEDHQVEIGLQDTTQILLLLIHHRERNLQATQDPQSRHLHLL